MYCRKCGKELDDEAVICPYCGVPTDNYKAAQAAPQESAPVPQKKEEEGSKNIGSLILGIIAAICGGISALLWMCIAAGVGACIGEVEAAFAYVLIFFFFGIVGAVLGIVGGVLAIKNKLAGLILLAISLVSQIITLIVCFVYGGIGTDAAMGVFFGSLGTIFAVIMLLLAVIFSLIGVIKSHKNKPSAGYSE